MSDPVVTAAALEKSFDGERVLEGVNLEVRSGELLAVMGPNGAGKSVLFACLAGSERPTAGSVEAFGRPATDRTDTTSFLLQDALCVDRLTGRENLRFFAGLHPHFTDRWREYVDALGIADELDKRVEHYSGGMKRKLELAIALAVDAPLYLLDEPTAPLDLGAVGTVHDLLSERQADGGTVVLSSHRPMDADIADRIAFVADGRVVATGAPDDLFASVPPVVETTLTDADVLAEIALDDEVFPADGGVRSFLAPGESVAGREGIERVDRTTYTDLFNYYAALGAADRDRGGDRT